MSGSRNFISAEYRELFNKTVQKQKSLNADDVTTSRLRKLQNNKDGLQLFGKLITQVFSLKSFLASITVLNAS